MYCLHERVCPTWVDMVIVFCKVKGGYTNYSLPKGYYRHFSVSINYYFFYDLRKR